MQLRERSVHSYLIHIHPPNSKLFVTFHKQSPSNELGEVQAVEGKDVVKNDLPEVHCVEYCPDSAWHGFRHQSLWKHLRDDDDDIFIARTLQLLSPLRKGWAPCFPNAFIEGSVFSQCSCLNCWERRQWAEFGQPQLKVQTEAVEEGPDVHQLTRSKPQCGDAECANGSNKLPENPIMVFPNVVIHVSVEV